MRWHADRNRRRARSGFTLIELIVVITIVLILLSMTVGALMKGFDWINRSNTERTITKVAERLERRFKGIENELKSLSPDAYDAYLLAAGAVTPFTLAGGNQDDDRRRAKVILRKYMIKWSFPMNYREAFVNANECGQSYPPATGIYKRLSARLGIALPSLPPLPANPDQEAAQAGACLALALQLMGLYDDLTGSELSDTNGDGFPEITDAYGHPVRYLRYGHMTTYVNGSVAVTPALTANMIARATLGFPTQNGVGGSTSFDCDDPDRLLSDAWYGAPGVSATFMTVFGHPLTPARIYAPMVIISAGRDGGFIAHPITGAAALDDNMDSYRLRIGLTGQ